MPEFRMPSLGADMEDGRLVEWTVAPGAALKRGDIIAVVETQKGAIEIEVFEEGVFERPLVEIGAIVPVGAPLAFIRGPGEAAQPAAPAEEAPPTAEAPPAEQAPTISHEPSPPEAPPAPSPPAAPPPPPAEPAAGTPPLEVVRATPAARRLAAERGIELGRLTPSGPSGEVTVADVERAAPAPSPEPEPEPSPATPAPTQTGGMREAIAAAMSRSKREIPHYYLSHTVDIEHAEEFVTRYNADRAPADRLLLGALLVKAVAVAAKSFPEFNGHFVDGTYRPSAAVHAGVAINIRGTGLVAPAIHDADGLEIGTLMSAMRDLVARVRAGRYRASELSDPTITISSLGERGVESLFGVIYPPQVAIVGFGMPVLRAWAADGMVGSRRVMTTTLAGDHRVSDGHRGALFLRSIEDLLTAPEAL